MQRLEVSGAVRPIYRSLGVKRLIQSLESVILEMLRLRPMLGLCVPSLFTSVVLFRKTRSHLKILGAIRTVTESIFQTEDPQILSATVQNFVDMATWHPGFVHSWFAQN
jgi:hypothetical protein